MANITFVTQNMNKVEDARKLLPSFNLKHIDFDVPEIQSLDTREIAKYKLEYAYEKVKEPCFVMDASLELDCLNGFPGPLVKWYYAKSVGAQKTCDIAKLFNEFGCKWTSILGYYDGIKSVFLEESVNGTIPTEPRGSNGYDWDVIFIPEGESRTFAQMSFEEKQTYAVTKKLLVRFGDMFSKV